MTVLRGQMDVYDCIAVAEAEREQRMAQVELKLATSSWSAMYAHSKAFDRGLADTDLMPVRISTGLPRFWKGANVFPCCKLITPYGLMSKDITEAEFDKRYLERLDGHGLEQIKSELIGIQTLYLGRTLVLLCFEKDITAEQCHRRLFAAWWQGELNPSGEAGELIPEWEVPHA